MSSVFLILGNQLFPKKYLKKYEDHSFFMAEDFDLCTYQKHHKLKILLFLSAMREYSRDLEEHGFNLDYVKLTNKNKDKSYEDKLKSKLKKSKKLVSFEIEDKFFEKRIAKLCKELKIEWEILQSPMFLSSRENFREYNLSVKKPFMKTFYERERKRLEILIDKNKKPEGGKWSFDSENRSKLPKKIDIPEHKFANQDSSLIEPIKELIDQHFGDHPGELNNVWFPIDRRGYLKNLNDFLKIKFENFGKYQDAITDRSPFLFHSLISPGLNMGLITPNDVVEKSLDFYNDKKNDVPINSVEGFIRQVIGWREFLRGIYQEYSEMQDKENFFNHKRKMKKCWYTGETGLPPVDDAIKKAVKYGYNHHIERLMVLSNVMLMTEINPKNVHDWFMEMYIDSSDWVMGPNVYGMGQFSDGGLFATKPYISGSNYILKMSDYKKGDWCDVMDGLYWQFIYKKQDFLKSNPRLGMMLSNLDKMKSDKKDRIFNAADNFRQRTTN